ncbi:MAG: protein kinase [Planctomycetota bacterium]
MSSNRPPSSSDHHPNDSSHTSDQDTPTLPGNGNIADSNQPTLPPQSGSTHETVGPPMSASDSVPREGVTFGDYELIEEIARGGMGVVFKARQKSLDRVVALKMILAGQFASEEEIRRFNAESTAAARLDHKNIVPIYDSGVNGDNHYFSMKLIEGSHLGKAIKELRSDLKSGVAVLEKVCRAIHHAHQRGILHRDLKPGNILIDRDSEPYVSDLGLARQVGMENELTRTGAVVGTPSYMPPEQAAGKTDITTSADIYSLGAILYELLAGRPPFAGANVMDTLMQVINEEPEAPSLNGLKDRNLELIALKCLSKDPKDRYPTAEALADDLHRWSNDEPISIRAPSFSVVAKNWLRQNFGSAIWILIVGLLTGCVAGLGLWFATVQQDMGDIRSVYEEMPSVDAPFTLVPWSTPDWAIIPWMVVFTSAIMFMGFLTAALVRTKNRSADLAAGISVGIISAAAAFFICFGTLCVVAMNMNNSDMEKILTGKVGAADDASVFMKELFNDYPELESLTQQERTKLMMRKIQADHLYQARNGIMTGTISCLFLFLTAGIAETLVAGPIVRRSGNLGEALGWYVFCSYPFVVATVICGVYMTGYVVFGDPGIIWNALTLGTIAALAVGMFAEIRKWHFAIRIILVGACSVFFWFFFAYGFGMMPIVSQGKTETARRLRLAERYPEKVDLKSGAINSMLRYGVKFYNGKYYAQADRQFIASLDYIETIPQEQMTDDIRSLWRTAISNRANTHHRMEQPTEAREIWLDAIREFPDDNYLRRRAVRFFSTRGQPEVASQLVNELKLENADDWNVLRELVAVAFPKITIDELIDQLNDRLENSQLSQEVVERLQAAMKRRQSWMLLGPVDYTKQEDIESKLFDVVTLSDARKMDSQFEWIVAETIDARSVDLRELLGKDKEHEYAAGYALACVVSESQQDVDLYLGSDDTASVWLNGEQLQEATDLGRELRIRQDHIPCQLKEGENLILLKIKQRTGDWEFLLQIDGKDGWQLPLEWLKPPPAGKTN